MKSSKLFVIVATIGYSYLFYQQMAGINFLLFTLLLIGINLAQHPNLIKNKAWISAAFLALTMGFLTFYYGYLFTAFCTVLSLFLMLGTALDAELSIISSVGFASLHAFTGIFIRSGLKLEAYIKGDAPINENKRKYKWYHFTTALIVLFIFVVIYRNASSTFTHVTNQIDLSFISPVWIAFTILGFALLYGALQPLGVFEFLKIEKKYTNNQLHKPAFMTNGFFYTGLTLFYLLNGLLFTVNLFDLLFLNGLNPKSMEISYADMIHQGINSLFFSLFLAVIFVMIWTNRPIEDESLNKKIKWLSVIWIFLNLILVLTNCYKNHLYISAYGLTEKRVQVYFSLGLALLMLAFCFYKILYNKNNWFLYRCKGIALAVVLLGYNTIDWDIVIVKQNISLYKSGKQYPDANYLLQLSDHVLPELANNWSLLNPQNNATLNVQLNERVQEFQREYESQSWRSFSYQQLNTYNALHDFVPASTSPVTPIGRY